MSSTGYQPQTWRTSECAHTHSNSRLWPGRRNDEVSALARKGLTELHAYFRTVSVGSTWDEVDEVMDRILGDGERPYGDRVVEDYLEYSARAWLLPLVSSSAAPATAVNHTAAAGFSVPALSSTAPVSGLVAPSQKRVNLRLELCHKKAAEWLAVRGERGSLRHVINIVSHTLDSGQAPGIVCPAFRIYCDWVYSGHGGPGRIPLPRAALETLFLISVCVDSEDIYDEVMNHDDWQIFSQDLEVYEKASSRRFTEDGMVANACPFCHHFQYKRYRSYPTDYFARFWMSEHNRLRSPAPPAAPAEPRAVTPVSADDDSD